MSQALSNLSLFLRPSKPHPLSGNYSGTSSNTLNPIVVGINGDSRRNCMGIKAMKGETRDNLNHLQRGPKHLNQTPPKKRTVPTPPIGLWDRFPTARTVQQMMETMERLVEDPFPYSGAGGPWPSSTAGGGGEGGYSRGRTPWDIKEGETEYKMRFDVPGMTRDDAKVWVEEKTLVIKAQKRIGEDKGREDEDNDDEEWSAKSYGRYSYRIALPENIRFEEIKAEVKDGVLYINIPKAFSESKILDINVQ